jgi:ABC-type Na+ transport system ATPase subunit NatA
VIIFDLINYNLIFLFNNIIYIIGECFGFLGINGAGKSTTLSILSGEIPQTSGEAFINNLNIQEHQITIRRKVGYCPQFDALIDLLTVREHLELYGSIKGIIALNFDCFFFSIFFYSFLIKFYFPN